MAQSQFVKSLLKSDFTSFDKAFGQAVVERTQKISRTFAEKNLSVKLPKSKKR